MTWVYRHYLTFFSEKVLFSRNFPRISIFFFFKSMFFVVFCYKSASPWLFFQKDKSKVLNKKFKVRAFSGWTRKYLEKSDIFVEFSQCFIISLPRDSFGQFLPPPHFPESFWFLRKFWYLLFFRHNLILNISWTIADRS